VRPDGDIGRAARGGRAPAAKRAAAAMEAKAGLTGGVLTPLIGTFASTQLR
jgi:hypothetical protein